MEYKLYIIFIHLSVLQVKAYTPDGYLGCYDDGNKRVLDVLYKSSENNSGDWCKEQCKSVGYRYAGTKSGNQCHCGTQIKITSQGSGCNIECPGNYTERCGGSTRISLYDTRPILKTTTPLTTSEPTTVRISTSVTSTVTTSATRFTIDSKPTTTEPLNTSYSRSPGMEEVTKQASHESGNSDELSQMIVYILVPVGCVAILVLLLVTTVAIRTRRRRSGDKQATQAKDDTKNASFKIDDIETMNTYNEIGDTETKNTYNEIGDTETKNTYNEIDDTETKNTYSEIGDIETKNANYDIGDLDITYSKPPQICKSNGYVQGSCESNGYVQGRCAINEAVVKYHTKDIPKEQENTEYLMPTLYITPTGASSGEYTHIDNRC